MQYLTWSLESLSYSSRTLTNILGSTSALSGTALPNLVRSATPHALHPVVNTLLDPITQVLIILGNLVGSSAELIPRIDF